MVVVLVVLSRWGTLVSSLCCYEDRLSCPLEGFRAMIIPHRDLYE